MEILGALRREHACDGDIDLASIPCLVRPDRIEIMECEFYVRILQFVSANEVRQERERCRTDKPDRKPPNFALGRPLGSEDGSLRLLMDAYGVRIK